MPTLAQFSAYLALAAGCVAEGELSFLAALAAAESLQQPIYIIWLVAYWSTLLTDLSYVWIGRRYAHHQGVLRASWVKQLEKLRAWIEQYPWWVLVGYRYCYGWRTILCLLIGTSTLSMVRIVVMMCLNTLLWTIIFGTLGHYFGTLAATHFPAVQRLAQWALLGLGLGFLGYVLLRRGRGGVS